MRKSVRKTERRVKGRESECVGLADRLRFCRGKGEVEVVVVGAERALLPNSLRNVPFGADPALTYLLLPFILSSLYFHCYERKYFKTHHSFKKALFEKSEKLFNPMRCLRSILLE